MLIVRSNYRPIFGMNCTQCGDLLIAPEWSEYEDAAKPGQGGSRKGMRPLRQRNGSRELSALLGKPAEGFLFGVAHHRRSGNLVPTCQPVQIAELAKSETYNDRN